MDDCATGTDRRRQTGNGFRDPAGTRSPQSAQRPLSENLTACEKSVSTRKTPSGRYSSGGRSLRRSHRLCQLTSSTPCPPDSTSRNAFEFLERNRAHAAAASDISVDSTSARGGRSPVTSSASGRLACRLPDQSGLMRIFGKFASAGIARLAAETEDANFPCRFRLQILIVQATQTPVITTVADARGETAIAVRQP